MDLRVRRKILITPAARLRCPLIVFSHCWKQVVLRACHGNIWGYIFRICSLFSFSTWQLPQVLLTKSLPYTAPSSSANLFQLSLPSMNSTHFRNQLTGSLFTKLECQIACALVEHVRTRRHRRGNRNHVDHTQPPTLTMLNDILQFVRNSLWYDAQRMGLSCNSMPPYAHLDAYCLVRSLRASPSHGGWYAEVENNPRYWKYKAYDVFDRWVDSRRQEWRECVDSRRQEWRECVVPFFCRLVNQSTANHR